MIRKLANRVRILPQQNHWEQYAFAAASVATHRAFLFGEETLQGFAEYSCDLIKAMGNIIRLPVTTFIFRQNDPLAASFTRK